MLAGPYHEHLSLSLVTYCGRALAQTFIVWKRRAQRNQMWKQHYKQLNRKRAARWVPRVFFKWLASAEEGKRERWKVRDQAVISHYHAVPAL